MAPFPLLLIYFKLPLSREGHSIETITNHLTSNRYLVTKSGFCFCLGIRFTGKWVSFLGVPYEEI